MRGIAAGLLLATVLAGCSLTGHLYPIQGPLASQTPAPIYPLTLDGGIRSASNNISSGSMTAILQDGEVCTGKWAAVAQDDPSANRMSAEWDRVYGPGYFVANILGTRGFGRSVLTGNKGTTLDLEFFEPPSGNLDAIRGVAKDNKGDLFKVTLTLHESDTAPNVPSRYPHANESTTR